MLILEIILTIFAWRKGWKWYSLLPVGLTILIGFFIGMAVGPRPLMEFTPLVFIDVLACVALIIMIVKPKKTNPPQS